MAHERGGSKPASESLSASRESSSSNRRPLGRSESALIEQIVKELREWRTSGMGGQTAMAIDNWADRLSALLGVPGGRQKEQEDVSRMAQTRDVSAPDATAGKE